MPYLRFHPASEVLSAGLPLRFSVEGFVPESLQLGPSAMPMTGPAPDVIGEVERAMDLVDRRLQNLRELVVRFGLDEDDGPKAA